jgi:OOP family OmpA-OmpF porin
LATATLVGCHAEVTTTTPPPPPPATQPAPPPPAPLPQTITIRDRIEFETDKAILLPQSLPILDEVVDVMKKNPQIQLIEIAGHTDNVGDDTANDILSQQRAESVRTYLASKGVEMSRMLARGYGKRVPIADITTEEGRLKNRRVEFRIMKQPGQ